MKDEIKEILDEYITDNDWIVIATNVLKYLKDYITNLQEENRMYKEHQTKLIGENELIKRIGELQEENKELKEDIKILTEDDDNDSVWFEEDNM